MFIRYCRSAVVILLIVPTQLYSSEQTISPWRYPNQNSQNLMSPLADILPLSFPISTQEFRPFFCIHAGCEKTFATRQNLQDHFETHRKEIVLKLPQFVCQVSKCKKRFKNNELFKSHISTHIAETLTVHQQPRSSEQTTTSLLYPNQESQNLILPTVPTYFSTSDQAILKEAMKIRDNQNKNTCTECKKKWSKPSALKRHLRIHTGEKPFKCSYPDCIHSSAERANLNRHIKEVHLGLKPFACTDPECSKTFARQSHLQGHLATHQTTIATATAYKRLRLKKLTPTTAAKPTPHTKQDKTPTTSQS